jgi:hypothetical protein
MAGDRRISPMVSIDFRLGFAPANATRGRWSAITAVQSRFGETPSVGQPGIEMLILKTVSFCFSLSF